MFDPSRWREFLRKYVSRRLLALSEGEIAALTAAMRLLAVGSQGAPGALAIFHQLVDVRNTGHTTGPNHLGLLSRVQCGTRQAPPLQKHAAVAGWKHRALSFMEQEGVQQMPTDRGAEQGNVDGRSECSLALGMVAAEARLRVAEQQAARTPTTELADLRSIHSSSTRVKTSLRVAMGAVGAQRINV